MTDQRCEEDIARAPGGSFNNRPKCGDFVIIGFRRSTRPAFRGHITASRQTVILVCRIDPLILRAIQYGPKS